MAQHTQYVGNQGKQQEQDRRDGQQRDRDKGKGGKPPVRIPLVNSIRTGFRYLITMLDEALLAAIFVLPVWAICYFMDIKEIVLPVSFPTFWSIMFFAFMLQNAMFRRSGGG